MCGIRWRCIGQKPSTDLTYGILRARGFFVSFRVCRLQHGESDLNVSLQITSVAQNPYHMLDKGYAIQPFVLLGLHLIIIMLISINFLVSMAQMHVTNVCIRFVEIKMKIDGQNGFRLSLYLFLINRTEPTNSNCVFASEMFRLRFKSIRLLRSRDRERPLFYVHDFCRIFICRKNAKDREASSANH